MRDTPDQTLLPAFPRLMGVVLSSSSPTRVEGYVDIGAQHGNRNGVAHGGVIMALADAVAGVAATLNLAPGKRTTTLESKTNFLRPLPLDQRATAICEPLHAGRKTCVLQTTVLRADGRPAAIVIQTQMSLDWVAPNP